MVDPMTGKEVFYAGGYDTENEDDVHQCGDAKPSASVSVTENDDGTWTVSANISNGRYYLQNYSLTVNGTGVKSGEISTSGTITYISNTEPTSASINVTDTGGYSTTANWNK
jgi:hypothetical protein